MDSTVVAAIRAVVAYLWASEHADYDRRDAASREGHVFRSLSTVAKWLNGHEHALVESVPVYPPARPGDRVIGWRVLFRGVLIGVVKPSRDAFAASVHVTGNPILYLGLFPTPDAAALAIVAAHTLHGYPNRVRREFLADLGGDR